MAMDVPDLVVQRVLEFQPTGRWTIRSRRADDDRSDHREGGVQDRARVTLRCSPAEVWANDPAAVFGDGCGLLAAPPCSTGRHSNLPD
jgi:hypothetical protein